MSRIEIEKKGATSNDATWRVLQQIGDVWEHAVLDLPGETPVAVRELALLPERRVYVIYRDPKSLFERRRFDGDPDPDSWLRLEVFADRLVFVVDGWSSASAMIVRGILGINRSDR